MGQVIDFAWWHDYLCSVNAFMVSDWRSLTYPALGLAGEYGELMEKLQLLQESPNPMAEQAAVLELGDIFWYCAAIDVDLSKHFGVEAENYDLTDSPVIRGQPYLPGRTMANIGKLVGPVKRILREYKGDFSLVPQEHAEKIGKANALVFANLVEWAHAIPLHVGRVCGINIEKLESRRQRGVLKGEGDQR
jgi:hypothetical protein